MLDISISGVNSFLNHPVKDHEGVFDVVGGLQTLHHDRHRGDHGAQPVEAVKEHLLLDPRHFGSSEEVKEPETKNNRMQLVVSQNWVPQKSLLLV